MLHSIVKTQQLMYATGKIKEKDNNQKTVKSHRTEFLSYLF